MRTFTRYAIYYLPEAALARFGAAWLGWDVMTGEAVAHPRIDDLPRPLSEITETPRPYGLHATLKPPFRLAAGTDVDALGSAVEALAGRLQAPRCDALALSRIGGFLALTPQGGSRDLNAVVGEIVTALDPFRAPLTEAELARRRSSTLTPAQEENLLRWGYPYVLDEFHFHITLSGKLDTTEGDAVEASLAPRLAGLLPAPFVMESVCLVGEQAGGGFKLIQRYPLSA